MAWPPSFGANLRCTATNDGRGPHATPAAPLSSARLEQPRRIVATHMMQAVPIASTIAAQTLPASAALAVSVPIAPRANNGQLPCVRQTCINLYLLRANESAPLPPRRRLTSGRSFAPSRGFRPPLPASSLPKDSRFLQRDRNAIVMRYHARGVVRRRAGCGYDRAVGASAGPTG